MTEATTDPSAVLHGGLVLLLHDVTCFLGLLETLPDESHA
ncbi:acyl-coenzyme A thioesterase PaaI-like protein [Nocardioides marinisabuli]|uniref:Acyl-coenzyme A thioesterase PaaI-like protein n=1 Tax=Nocardioides marinisabuli TaxID=419476 RepID=A0A7Y9F071_9ACTN|nr:acyl-coenzyme A thioesterase PaaI-like protein [Nocardioides marinisabuli]